jgi:GT2 family glycosyltransferase
MSVDAPFSAPRSSLTSSVRAAALLTDQVLLVVANDGLRSDQRGALAMHQRGISLRTLEGAGAASLQIVTVQCEELIADNVVAPLRLPPPIDLTQLLREHLAPLGEAARADVIAFVTKLLDIPVSQPQRLATSLRRIREALRARRPTVEDPTAPRGMRCEGIASAGGDCFFAWGWAFDRQAQSVRLCAVTPEGLRIDLTDDVAWHAHPHVDTLRTRTDRAGRSGFFCKFTAPAGSSHEGWLVEMHSDEGAALESRAPSLLVEPQTVLQAALEQLTHERPATTTLLAKHVHPVLARVQRRLSEGARSHEVHDFGTVQEHPTVSIVVPVFERPDLIEQQLAAFSTDRDIASLAQVVYVIDSPWMADQIVSRSAAWFDLYRVPFRVVTMEQRAGFAGACRVGASACTGRSMLLLHSDVLPTRPGWLGTMVWFHREQANAGAVGCRLLYPDGTLQHQGFTITRRGGNDGWRVRQPLKGLHAHLSGANHAPRAAAAVSAACLLVDRQLFHDVGGLCGEYPSGDYEDVDLCMRLARAGRTNWHLPNVSLHHLEGQSRSRLLADAAARYNASLFNSRWGDVLDAAEQSHAAHRAQGDA